MELVDTLPANAPSACIVPDTVLLVGILPYIESEAVSYMMPVSVVLVVTLPASAPCDDITPITTVDVETLPEILFVPTADMLPDSVVFVAAFPLNAALPIRYAATVLSVEMLPASDPELPAVVNVAVIVEPVVIPPDRLPRADSVPSQTDEHRHDPAIAPADIMMGITVTNGTNVLRTLDTYGLNSRSTLDVNASKFRLIIVLNVSNCPAYILNYNYLPCVLRKRFACA